MVIHDVELFQGMIRKYEPVTTIFEFGFADFIHQIGIMLINEIQEKTKCLRGNGVFVKILIKGVEIGDFIEFRQ
jgi:hypothetical protein